MHLTFRRQTTLHMVNSILKLDPTSFPKLTRGPVLTKKLNDLYPRVHIDQALRWLGRQMQGSVERAGSLAKDFQLNRQFFLNS
jgi:hypothetical protein